MEITIPIFDNFSLKIGNKFGQDSEYPTESLQKGLILFYDRQNLAEEAIGFGVPVIKEGVKTIFAGSAKISSVQRGGTWTVMANYEMNLVEKIGRFRKPDIENPILVYGKNLLAALHRNVPATRNSLVTLSNRLRQGLVLETRYESVKSVGELQVSYYIIPLQRKIIIKANLRSIQKSRISEIVMMNEQGANFFTQFQDSNSTRLADSEVNSWERVTADQAEFICPKFGLKFSVRTVRGARLFRGRELIGTRLAWAGFGYSLNPKAEEFSYELRLEEIK